MKRQVIDLAKSIFRATGLLKPLRRALYRLKYRTINRLRGKPVFSFEYEGLTPLFSLKDPFSLTFFSYYFKDSIYEEAALRLILQHTREGSIFADIGANIGYFSVMAALRAPSAQVVAFELGSENCSIISKNIRLNALGNIELVHCAVSDSTGKVFCVDSPVGNAVLKIIEKPNEKDSDLIEVPAVRLDDFFQERKSPDFIKIDVEGAELKVLKGMRRMAQGVSHVLIEIHPGDLLRFGGSEQAVLNELTAMGFEFKEIQKDAQKNRLVHAYRNKP